jgi:hypothetical protein
MDELMAEASCLSTCMPPGLLMEAKTYLLCEVVDNLPSPEPTPPTPCTHPLVDDPVTGWAARVVANGGAEVFPEVRQAMCVFATGLDAAGLTSKMIAVNCVAPYDLIGAITPLIKGPGSDPWTNVGFVGGDLSNDGLKANGIGKYLRTGVVPSTALANDTDVGLTIYNMTALNYNCVEMGANAGNGFTIELINSYNDALKNCYFDAYDFVNRFIRPNPLWAGYLSANKRTGVDKSVYKANDTTPFTTVGASTPVGGGARPNIEIFAFGINSAGLFASPSPRRFSFMAIHLGLTAAQSEQLYNLVRTLRGSLLGGFV